MNEDNYRAIPFPKARQPVVDSLRYARQMSAVHIITEVDVTGARRNLREFRKETGGPLSFTAFLTCCLAKAVDEDKSMQAYQKGNRLVIFDDVDVSVIIERGVDGYKAPVFPHIVNRTRKRPERSMMKSGRRSVKN